MRDIKFRAWDGILKYMVDGSKYHITLDGSAFFNNDGEFYDQTNKLELMQYTGLKDKNGKEVFEGDIVSYDMIDGDEVCEVFWDAGSVKMKFKESGGWQSYSVNVEDVEKRVLIIGNIYENPELLEA